MHSSTSLATVLFPTLLVAGAGAFVGGLSANLCSKLIKLESLPTKRYIPGSLLEELESCPTKKFMRRSMAIGMIAGLTFGLLCWMKKINQ